MNHKGLPFCSQRIIGSLGSHEHVSMLKTYLYNVFPIYILDNSR